MDYETKSMMRNVTALILWYNKTHKNPYSKFGIEPSNVTPASYPVGLTPENAEKILGDIKHECYILSHKESAKLKANAGLSISNKLMCVGYFSGEHCTFYRLLVGTRVYPFMHVGDLIIYSGSKLVINNIKELLDKGEARNEVWLPEYVRLVDYLFTTPIHDACERIAKEAWDLIEL